MAATRIHYDMTDGSTSYTDAAGAEHDMTGMIHDPSQAKLAVDDQGRLVVSVGLVADQLVITPATGDPITIDSRLLGALRRLGGL